MRIKEMITDQKAPDCQTKLILHVITMDNVERPVWRIWMLILWCKGLIEYCSYWYLNRVLSKSNLRDTYHFCMLISFTHLTPYMLTSACIFSLLHSMHSFWLKRRINPLTPMSDQDRISLYNINTMSTR